MKRLGQKGFSLVELLVVVAIIAMLAAVGLPMYNRYRIRSAMSAATGEAKSYINAWMAALNQGDSNFTLGGYAGTHVVANIDDCGGTDYIGMVADSGGCFRSRPFLDSDYSTNFCRIHVRPSLSRGEVTFHIGVLGTDADGTSQGAHLTPGLCYDLIADNTHSHLRVIGGHTYSAAAANF